MKIAHICPSLGKGGAEKLLVEFLPLFVAAGHDVSLFTLSSRGEVPAYKTILQNAKVKMVTLSHSRFRRLSHIGALHKVLKDGEYDIVHVHLFPCIYFVPLALKGLKHKPVLVYTEHNTTNKRASKPYLKPIERYFYRHYDACIGITEGIVQRFSKWTGLKDKWVHIPNGVPIAKFQHAVPLDDDSFRKELEVKPETKLVGMVARFCYPKDQKTLIDSLKYLPDHVHVVLLGDGDEKENLTGYVRHLGLHPRVHFLGFRNDVPSVIKNMSVLVLSSNHEGMSGVTLEALASGVPFLGSNVPGINDVVPNNSNLFECGNAQDLANKIDAILNNDILAGQMSIAGLNYVQQFDISEMAARYLELYQRKADKR